VSVNERRRRTTPTGALAQILAEEQSNPEHGARETSGTVVSIAVADQPVHRYYPTKGRAKVAPEVCRLWRYADRPAEEAGHAVQISESFKEDGQIAAVIVRCVEDPVDPTIRYEVISGHVRWRAALAAKTDLDVDIRELDDKAAFRLMVRENELRRALSDYAKARRLKRVLADGIYDNRAALAADMGLSPAQLSYFLGFADLPEQVVRGFREISRVSVRLGYAVARAVQEGFGEQVLQNLKDIEAGVISRDQIPSLWVDPLAKATVTPVSRQTGPVRAVRYARRDGTPLFSVRESGESGPVLRFSKVVGQILDETFWADIQKEVEARLAKRTDFSTEK
jgi:ParB/RepB/Spo0J family partition protein